MNGSTCSNTSRHLPSGPAVRARPRDRWRGTYAPKVSGRLRRASRPAAAPNGGPGSSRVIPRPRAAERECMTEAQPLPPAGWYPDGVTPAVLRWFDGAAWTEHTAPDPAAQAAAPPAAPVP
ncbi:MAG: DUF2510 domain-containing protein, partial [Cellulomonas sp.]